jgi:Predicted membrane protein
MEKTRHFEERQRTRRISDESVFLALRYGQRFYEGEDRVYFLGRKHLRRVSGGPGGAILDERERRRADGTVVVVGPDGQLVTTYRNPRFCRTLRRRQH